MSEDNRRGGADDHELGPGMIYNMYEVMSNLCDKLKLLNYEENFLRPNHLKPFSRHYFALATNPGEQFFNFTALCAWLINVAGRHFDIPQEYDDPNATIANIIEEMKRFGLNADFAPSKLKTGNGEYVCHVLDQLSDVALKATNFSWKQPSYPLDNLKDDDDNIQDEDESELKLDKIEDDFVDAVDESDEEAETFLDLGEQAQKVEDTGKSTEIMQSNTNYEEWKLEVERVTPSLKVTIRTDNKDWRTHVDQMGQHKNGIEKSLNSAKSQLDRLHDEIQRVLEKVNSREKYINNQLEGNMQEYRNAQDRLAQAKEKYKEGSTGVTERSRALAELTDELEKVKIEMEEKGSSMTDGAPLIKIKQTLNHIKTECTQMDVRIGVIEHVLSQAQIRDKTMMSKGVTNGLSLANHINFMEENSHVEANSPGSFAQF